MPQMICAQVIFKIFENVSAPGGKISKYDLLTLMHMKCISDVCLSLESVLTYNQLNNGAIFNNFIENSY